MKFWCPEPSKKVFDFWNFCSSKRRLTRFVRVPPYGNWVFPTNFIFFQGNEITLRGKKCTALFQTPNWEKSSFFNELVCIFYRNTQIRNRGAQCAPPGQIGLNNQCMVPLCLWQCLKSILWIMHLKFPRSASFICTNPQCCLIGRRVQGTRVRPPSSGISPPYPRPCTFKPTAFVSDFWLKHTWYLVWQWQFLPAFVLPNHRIFQTPREGLKERSKKKSFLSRWIM